MRHIHLIAPSGACLDPRSSVLGIESLRALGIDVRNIECLDRVFQRFAGTDLERLTELNQLSGVSAKNVVMVTRGGYGLHRLLHEIDWSTISANIKNGLQICGHSDFTVFQLALLAKTGAITLAGPMFNYDFASQTEQGDVIPPNAFMWKHFQRALDDRSLNCQILAPQSYLSQATAGKSSGLLWGGNLTILAGLVGTPYLPSFEKTKGGILFLEDVNEHPYRIERMLMQLLDAGILSNQSAILLGGFSAFRLHANDRGYSLDVAIDAVRKRIPSSIPVITELPFGHQADKLTLPVGALAHIQFDPHGFAIQSQW